MTAASTSKDSPQSFPELGINSDATERLLELFKETLEETLRKVRTGAPGSSSPRPLLKVHEAASESQSPGTELKPQDKIKAVDLRVALLMGKVPDDSGLLIGIKTVAKLLSVSPAHLRRLLDLKAIPESVHLGRLMRWRVTEVLEWIESDCPMQKAWEIKKQEAARRKLK